MKQTDVSSVTDLIQLIHVPSVLLSCHIESSVLVSADEQSWLQVDLSEPKPCCWTQISIPVALVMLCWSPYGNARSAWRYVTDLPSWVVFSVWFIRAFSAQVTVSIHMRHRYSHMICQFWEVCPGTLPLTLLSSVLELCSFQASKHLEKWLATARE